MTAWIEFGSGFFDRPALNAIALVTVAFLMISRVPTFSIKQIRVQPSFMLPALLLVGVMAAALASAPFMTFLLVGVIYLASIPVSIWMRAKAQRSENEAPAQPASFTVSTTPPPSRPDSAA
jgi:CDP-diacylglycerol--serine O-phosphatidyltransferase